ncbi:AAA family ATPase [Prevotella sp. A2931]|uniref:AAA family ATPase n=1 Tax=Prevotella illustrans TaxID=2800387 RepID=A0ABS3M4F8_9BACT|nr:MULTISPECIES: AAA domain-containing protein [Prevotella]MBO1363062.1 AAA family ATPase [Prevotella illustrans]PTL26888.1 helicase [Prevotella sp. oral taxon 820]
MRTAIEELKRQKLLLQMEYYAEKDEFRRQTEAAGVARKVKRGDAWYPLRMGKSFYNSLNQRAVEVFRTVDQDIEHNFEFGRPVMFFREKPQQQSIANRQLPPTSLYYYHFTGTVSYVDGDRMVVIVPDSAPLSDLQSAETSVGVQLSFDETSYRTMFDALDRVIAAKDNRLAYLRDLFYSNRKAERFSFQPIAFPWLNPTQERAVNEVLRAKDVAVVHGPPGTGKTTTLVEAVNETLMRESQVLVCAQSNMAVDWICEKLTDRGVNVLRIGNPTRVNDKMLGFTYERRFEAHPDYPQLWSLRKAIRELRGQRRKGGENYHQKTERLKARATELEIRINADLFGEARVIASTLVGSAHRTLEGMKFGTLFIDEAAQALEAACWIPMRRVTRVVLAGDHCQLPPTVKSIAALRAGLGKTLMERIVENKPETVTLLKIQYRMNEKIMRFSSNWFYHGQVESAPQIRYRGILDYDRPIEWRDSLQADAAPDDPQAMEKATGTYGETFVGASFGRVNKAEARLTLDTLRDYLTKIGRQRVLDERIDVGVISPYRAQVQYLRGLIRGEEFFKPYRRLISVNTVDGFQGQERDIILVSLVRSNDEGQIGFLRDLRRMNVAITRARMKLIILGDVRTLTRHPFYKKLYEYATSE